MNMDFAGKTVLVTGGGRGIGRDIVLTFARRGAHVIINYFHSREEAEQTLADVRAFGGSAELVRASVGNQAGVDSLFTAVAQGHQRLDVLVNNAVFGVLGNPSELSDDDWRRTLDVNLHGVRRCIAAAVPLMCPAGGAIVNMSTQCTEFILDRYMTLAASRAAQDSMSRYLAAELGPLGIRVNVVAPGLVDNYAFDYWPHPDERKKRARLGTVLDRIPASEDVAEVVVFLASDAARAVTGANLQVDAGMSLWLASYKPAPTAPAAVSAQTNPDAVAVVGMGIAVPGASSPEAFWSVLNRHENTFGGPEGYSLNHWFSSDVKAEDKSYVRAAGYIHGFTPHPQLATELEQGRWAGHDATAVLLRHCVLQALDSVSTAEGDRAGCYVGAVASSLALEEAILLTAAPDVSALRGSLAAHYARAVSVPRGAFPDRMIQEACEGLLPADSELMTVDTACSSSLYAIDLGVKSLLAGERDLVLCGGSNTGARRDLVLFAKLQALSATGEIRAFDADAAGVLFSDAAAVVALKRLDRALADGDEILGLLGGFGGSVDGQGSVMATDPVGQKLAVRRAREVNALAPVDVQWVIGHGTGTRVGDAAELESLAELAGTDGHLVTSNKPLVGHGGWAAGAVSVVHALLALRHRSIPGERYFTRVPDDIQTGRLTVPVTDSPFDLCPGQRRTVGICAYGLGGTNAHLVVHGAEQGAGSVPRAAIPPRYDDDIVLVGWHTHLPGEPSREETVAWLRGSGHQPALSFGAEYPLPPIQQLRMPPLSARSTDRTHLMALAVTSGFTRHYGELWTKHREKTGVITGHMGPTRSMQEYTVRAGADDLTAAVAECAEARSEDLRLLREQLDTLRTRLPAANDASMPGQLANIIACRVANQLRLNGVSLAVDSGRSSTQAALHVAGRYLATRELDVALVLGINGNSTPAMAELAGLHAHPLAEGAALLMVTRRSLAEERGWPVLAVLRTEATSTPQDDRAGPLEINGASGPDDPCYLGAEGAFAVLRAVHSGLPETFVPNEDPGPRVFVTTTATPATSPQAQPEQRDAVVDRSVLTFRRTDAVPEGSPAPSVRTGALILVDSTATADALAGHAQQAGAHIVSTDPNTIASDQVTVIRPGQEKAGITAAVHRNAAARDLLVIASARRPESHWPAPPPPALLCLQDCAMLAVQALGDRLDKQSSVAALLLDPLCGHTTHPHLTLLTGFMRSLAHELPCPVVAVVTDATLESGLDQLGREWAARRDRTVVQYRQGLRYTEQVYPAPLPSGRSVGALPSGRFVGALPRNGQDTVIVATGGARGATAVSVRALAERIQPRIWLLGTTDADLAPEELIETSDDDLITARSTFIAQQLNETPGARLPELNQHFDTLLRAREIQQTLRELRQLCGEDRVHYLVCDLRDRNQVITAAKEVLAHEGRVDLLIHGAGRIRSADAKNKPLDHFREVRDVKVAGYHHLKEAFAESAPHLWCNFSSGSALLGFAGDTDYAAANEYLLAAARYQNLTDPGEFTLGWGLWTQTGMVKDRAGYLSRQFSVTGIDNVEGAEIFRTELAAPRSVEPNPLYGLGRGWDSEAWPALTPASTYQAERRLLDAPRRIDGTSGRWTWKVDQQRDRYLAEHLIDGRPVLPAVMMLAMAAEAARYMIPDTAVTGFRAMVIDAPLYTDPGGSPISCRITAETHGQNRVRVELHSDLSTPGGQILVRDRRHCRVDVLLGEQSPPPQQQPPSPTPPLEDDPATRPDTSVQLSGIWRTLLRPGADADGADALWHPRLTPDEIFAHLVVPALLIDSLGRLVGYPPLPDGQMRMAVPVSIAQIDIHTTDNDVTLARKYPEGLRLWYRAGDDRAVAATAQGDVLLAITGLTFHTVDKIPPEIQYPEWRPWSPEPNEHPACNAM